MSIKAMNQRLQVFLNIDPKTSPRRYVVTGASLAMLRDSIQSDRLVPGFEYLRDNPDDEEAGHLFQELEQMHRKISDALVVKEADESIYRARGVELMFDGDWVGEDGDADS
jgi:hypothetical protein